jgi:hypothetical protein
MANWWESAPVVEEKPAASSTPEWLKNAPVVEQEPRSVTITPDRPRAAPVTKGEQQAAADKELVDRRGGSATEAGFLSGANMALYNIPSHVIARYRASKEGRPYSEVYKEQKQYEEALARQFPTASTVGDVAGFGAGMFVPLGPLAKAGQAAGAIGSKIGPAAGRVSQIAGTSAAASGASSLIEQNPFALTEKSVGEALKDAGIGAAAGAGLGVAGQKFASYLSRKPDAFVDGKPTQETLDAFKAAFGSKLSPEDLDLTSEKVMSVLAKKGPSKASMVEALAAQEGLPTSRAMVTGTRAPEVAAPAAEKALVDAKEKLADTYSSVIGKPSDVSVPGALLDAEAAAKARAAGQLEDVKEIPGEFARGMRFVEKKAAPGAAEGAKPVYTTELFNILGPIVNRNVSESLSASRIGFPDNIRSQPNFPQSSDALNFLDRTIGADSVPIGNTWDFKNVMYINRQLNSFWYSAKDPTDRAAVSAIKDGYLNAVNEAITRKLFTGDGDEALKSWAKSKKDWQEYKSTFAPEKAVEARAFNGIMASMFDNNGKLVSDLTPSLEIAANAAINSGVLNKKAGVALLDRLEGILGKDTDVTKALHQQIRQKMLDVGGDISRAPKAIEKFLAPENIELAKRVLPPTDTMTTGQQISQLRRIAAMVDKVNQTKMPDEQKKSIIMKALSAAPTAIGAFLGYPHGIVATIGMAALGKGAGDIAQGAIRSSQAASEAFGAPVFKRPFEMPETRIPGAPEILQPQFMPSVRNVDEFGDSLSREEGYQLPPVAGTRPGRASGGKVMDAEALADRLVGMAEQAKNKHKQNTKPLLNAPDEHIAKALEIANQHI